MLPGTPEQLTGLLPLRGRTEISPEDSFTCGKFKNSYPAFRKPISHVSGLFFNKSNFFLFS